MSDLSHLPQGHLIGLQHSEHDALRRLVDRLEVIAGALQGAGDQREEYLLDLLCLVHYMGRAENHHLREERVLFPALAENGVDRALLERLEQQHQLLWRLQGRLRHLAGDRHGLRERARFEALTATCTELVARTRAHLSLEDEVLFPLALEVLSPEAWGELHERGRELSACSLELRRPGVA